MIVAADSSILIASLLAKDPHHEACARVLEEYRPFGHRHALAETFSVLTGGRLGFRMSPDQIAEVIRESILPWVRTTELDDAELLDAMSISQVRGVRGGAIFPSTVISGIPRVMAGATMMHSAEVTSG